MSKLVETELAKYKRGDHVHLTSPLDSLLLPDELMALQKERRALLSAIYAHEMQLGNITKVAGKYVFHNGVEKRLPMVRCADNLWCCISAEDKKRCEDVM